MRNTGFFKNKNITIVGLARSGVACANLLHGLGAIVRITDLNNTAQTKAFAKLLVSPKIKLELGKHSKKFIETADLVVISPGVPNCALPIVWAKKLAKPVYAEIEVASLLCPAEIIAVTGANGKTTVTTLIGQIIRAAGKRVFVCGNIGNPFSGEVKKMRQGDFVVLEVSSFQLENIRDFKPKIAVITNVTQNHLDRYKNMQEYLEAKKRIFLNQDQDDLLILNGLDPLLKKISSEPKARVEFFKEISGLNSNQAVAFKVGIFLGINRQKILRVFKKFKSLEHRLEEVASINRIKFINDSKATTAESTIWALKRTPAPVILIAGGRDKGIDYRVIKKAAKDKVKHLILIGEAKNKIAASLKEEFPVVKAKDLKEAVGRAFALAKPGFSVLLSPMCSSYDMFTDYEDRGRAFKKIVFDLAKMNKIHG